MRFALLVTSFQCSLIIYLCRVLAIEFMTLQVPSAHCPSEARQHSLSLAFLHKLSPYANALWYLCFPSLRRKDCILNDFFSFCRAMLNPFAYFLRIVFALFLLRSSYMLIISIHDYNEPNRTTSRFWGENAHWSSGDWSLRLGWITPLKSRHGN